MTQIHLVLRRVNPALKIDFAQVGHIEDGQFVSLPVWLFENTALFTFLKNDAISDSHYIFHSDISLLVSELSTVPGFSVDYFDNTLVLMFDYNIVSYEGTSKEEGEGH